MPLLNQVSYLFIIAYKCGKFSIKWMMFCLQIAMQAFQVIQR